MPLRNVSARLLLTLAVLSMTPLLAASADGGTARDISRIVSVGGAVTEILYALGLEQNIVGIDSTSAYPPRAAKEKPSVGYMRQLSSEGVLGLRPTLIIAIEGSGPKTTMDILNAARVPLTVVPDSYSGPGIVEKIRTIGAAVGKPREAQCLMTSVQDDLAALGKVTAGIEKKRRVLFILSSINGRAMVSGRHTAADGIIRMAGGVNAVSDYDGYKILSDEAVIAAKPDVVLTMQRGGPGVVTADSLFAHAAFAATPAAARRSFVAMEGLYLLGFGPRTARAARDLAAALYPGLAFQALPSEAKAADAAACPR